jgi:hypothetical protein
VNRVRSVIFTDQTGPMAILRSRRSRVGAAAFASALLFAACGGSGDSAEPSGSALAPPPDEAELDPAADTVANQLPDVIVDDVGRGNKVNLRNLAPADTPILLWMYAPH